MTGNKMKSFFSLVVLIVGSFSFVNLSTRTASTQPISTTQTYSITNLGTLPGNARSVGNAINNNGQVVGYSDGRAFLWDSTNGMQNLGVLPGDLVSAALGLNNLGQVTGYSGTSTTATRAFIWDSVNGMQSIETPPDITTRVGRGVNDAGQVTGNTNQLADQSMFIWDPIRGFQTLPTVPDARRITSVQGINKHGTVVGFVTLGYSPASSRSFIWSEAEGYQILPTLGGLYTNALSINDAEQVTGSANTGDIGAPRRAFIWDRDQGIRNLGSLPGHNYSAGLAINNHGVIVGTSGVSSTTGLRAIIWDQENGLRDLNDLIPADSGWTLVRATGINDHGQITGEGLFNGQTRAFLLTPPQARRPYHGAPVVIPGKVEAEDFDLGGQAVAYFDTTAGNTGEQYRLQEDVDIKATTDAGAGYAVGWFNAGEWLSYTVDVKCSTRYTIEIRVGSAIQDRTFHIEIGGQDVTGPIAVPVKEDWDQYETVKIEGVELQEGIQEMRIVMGGEDYMDINWVSFTPSEKQPYGGVPKMIPGIIEAEEFDLGGQYFGYFDTTAGNTGEQFRTDEDVDIKATTDSGGGYAVGWFNAREWLGYTVDVQTAGVYQIEVRVGSAITGRTFHIEMDGVDVTGPIAVPVKDDWDQYETVTVSGVSLQQGVQQMRIVMGWEDYMDLNWVRFTLQ